MINICTVSDINYLIKGLTLYESLLKYSKNFKLHYLCIDDQSYEIAKKHESETLIIYNVSELLSNDEILLKLKNSNYRYFCWSLASYFSNFLINKNNFKINYSIYEFISQITIDNMLNIFFMSPHNI